MTTNPNAPFTCLAVDLGASSGRVIAGRLDAGRLSLEDVHRFENGPVEMADTLTWPFNRLLTEIKTGLRQGIRAAREAGAPVRSIAVDSWGVDFGLLDERGELLDAPVHYRDPRTRGVMESVFESTISKKRIYELTGIQFLLFNTVYQLTALNRKDPALLDRATHFLMISDLVQYFLTGRIVCEFTNATTTQLYDPTQGGWCWELIDALGLPRRIFGEILQPGTPIGPLTDAAAEELDTKAESIRVIAAATHDTGSAVAAVPSDSERFAYLSCGTWSLLGTETRSPVLTPEALEFSFTNEGGVEGTYRLLTNIMGLWLLQESRAEWRRCGRKYSWDQVDAMAEEAEAFRSFVNPDDPVFLEPGDMPERIRAYCRKTGQPVPDTDAAVVRCILESLCLKYRFALERLETLTGSSLPFLHMVGGGIRNTTLCRWAADACGRPVVAGPVEATAIGNIGMQLQAAGAIPDLAALRALVRESFSPVQYDPRDTEAWDRVYPRFQSLMET